MQGFHSISAEHTVVCSRSWCPMLSVHYTLQTYHLPTWHCSRWETAVLQRRWRCWVQAILSFQVHTRKEGDNRRAKLTNMSCGEGRTKVTMSVVKVLACVTCMCSWKLSRLGTLRAFTIPTLCWLLRAYINENVRGVSIVLVRLCMLFKYAMTTYHHRHAPNVNQTSSLGVVDARLLSVIHRLAADSYICRRVYAFPISRLSTAKWC